VKGGGRTRIREDVETLVGWMLAEGVRAERCPTGPAIPGLFHPMTKNLRTHRRREWGEEIINLQ